MSKLTSRFAGQQFFKLLGYGYQYHSQVIVPDNRKTRPGFLDGRPGTRAPHAWVEYQGQRISTLDLFGTSFVLLAGSEGTAWCEAARATAARQNIDLVAYSAGPKGDLRDPESRWQAKAGISANGALLVRPDGFVAWRASEQAGNLQQKLEQVLKRALGQVPAGA